MTQWFSVACVHKAQVTEVCSGQWRCLFLFELLGKLCPSMRAAPRHCLLEIDKVSGGGTMQRVGLADHPSEEM